MEFGRIDDLSGIDFTLPEDPVMTTETLRAAKGKGQLQVYVGCTKWAHKPWLGLLYPLKTLDKDFLLLYTGQFNTIEFGPTFYTMPDEVKIRAWKNSAELNPGFKFCPKFPQSITHIRRLRNAEQLTVQFYHEIRAFSGHLGSMLLQLGEAFSPKSFDELQAYLPQLPKDIPVLLEVRHKDWFGIPENRDKLFNLLSKVGIGAAISDAAGRRDCVHMQLPTPHAMIRFVGSNHDNAERNRLDEWVERIKIWREEGLQSLYFFMHQHDERFAPQACAYLIQNLNDKLGLRIKAPVLIDE